MYETTSNVRSANSVPVFLLELDKARQFIATHLDLTVLDDVTNAVIKIRNKRLGRC